MNIKKRIISGAVALSVLSAMNISAYAKSFPDANGHWAEKAIGIWSDNGVINGDDKGNFRPGDSITRAETATVLDNLIGYVTKTNRAFTDVFDGDWFFDAISKLNYAEVITGYEDGSIRPKSPITRQEAAVVIARATGLDTGKADLAVLDRFEDKDIIQAWAKEAVALMTERGYIQGNEGKFRPADSITRAEVITIIDNIVGIYANGNQIQYVGDYGNKLAIIKSRCTLKGVTLGGAVISPGATGAVVFNNASQINGRLYDLSTSATVSTSGASVDSILAPYKKTQNNYYGGGNYGGGNYGGGGSGGSGSNSSTAKYTVKYDANGGKFDKGNSGYYIATYKHGEIFNVYMPSDPTRNGYIFVDWYTSEKGAKNLDNIFKIDPTSRVTSTQTLYAGWKVDESLYASVKPAVGKIDNKNVSELMDIKLSQSDSINYAATGKLNYVTNFSSSAFPLVDRGYFIVLTYSVPSDIKKPENVTLDIKFGTKTEQFKGFTSDIKSYTFCMPVTESTLENPIVLKTTVADTDNTYDDLTVDISKITLAGCATVKSESELKTALSDNSVTTIILDGKIELKDGENYAPSNNTKKMIYANTSVSGFALPENSTVTIKNLGFGGTADVLITDNGAKNFVFDGNTISGTFGTAISAKDGNIVITNNMFESGYSGKDATKKGVAVSTGENGTYKVNENTFDGYKTAVDYNCTAEKMTLEKNIFVNNETDISFPDVIYSAKEEMPSAAYNFYDGDAKINGKAYIAYPVYTDKDCTKMSDNLRDAWIIVKIGEVTKIYGMNEISYIPYTDGVQTEVSVLAKDARSMSADITIGDAAPSQKVTVDTAATVLTIDIDGAVQKQITVGHTSTDIEVMVSADKEMTSTSVLTADKDGNFSYDATALPIGSVLYVKITPADKTQAITGLGTEDGTIEMSDENAAEITLVDKTVVYTINSVVSNDGTPVVYTITIKRAGTKE